MNTNGERARWVERYRASGLGLKRFAAEHGLSAGKLHYWTYSPDVSTAAAKNGPVFQEITSLAPWKSERYWMAEIGLADGTTVRLDGRAEVAWVKQLVESLRRSCSR